MPFAPDSDVAAGFAFLRLIWLVDKMQAGAAASDSELAAHASDFHCSVAQSTRSRLFVFASGEPGIARSFTCAVATSAPKWTI